MYELCRGGHVPQATVDDQEKAAEVAKTRKRSEKPVGGINFQTLEKRSRRALALAITIQVRSSKKKEKKKNK